MSVFFTIAEAGRVFYRSLCMDRDKTVWRKQRTTEEASTPEEASPP